MSLCLSSTVTCHSTGETEAHQYDSRIVTIPAAVAAGPLRQLWGTLPASAPVLCAIAHVDPPAGCALLQATAVSNSDKGRQQVLQQQFINNEHDRHHHNSSAYKVLSEIDYDLTNTEN